MTFATAVCAMVAGTPAAPPPSAPPNPVGYERFIHGKRAYHVVTADLSAGGVRFSTVHGPGLTSVWNMVHRTRPVAAITGTFFSPRWRKPVADLLVDGKLVSRGSIGSAIGVGWYGGVDIFDVPFKTPANWDEYRFGFRGAVRVVSNGKVQPNPAAQRFKDKRIWGRAARTGIGLTKNHKLLLFATSSEITLSELGRAMRAKGVVNGVSLDGGQSTCLYYKGSMVVPPRRLLNNLFVIHSTPAARIAEGPPVPKPVASAAVTGESLKRLSLQLGW